MIDTPTRYKVLCTDGPITSILYEGESYLGNPTEVFAYLGVPRAVTKLCQAWCGCMAAAANDGSTSGGTITVTEGTFTGDIGTNYVLGGEVLVSNIPSGLAVSIVKTALNFESTSTTARLR